MSLGALIRNGEEILHALYISAKFMQREPKAFLSPLASPQSSEGIWYKWPYLHSLNIRINSQGRPAAVPSARPPGHRDCLGASTPKTFLRRMLGGGSVGGAVVGGAVQGGPSPPCHSATTWQRSSHNAPGQDKREHHPVCQSWPRGSPKTCKQKSLRSRWNSLEGAEGGRLETGGGCWKFSAARPAASRATFKLI